MSDKTPELQQWIKNYKERNRRNSAKTYERLRKKVENNAPLTEREIRRLQAQNKSKEWRDRDPKNQARYERHLEYNRRKRKEQKEEKAANEQQKGLQKRAVHFGTSSSNITMLRKRGNIDLNLPPPEEESSNDQAMNEKESTQDIPNLTNHDASQKSSKLKKSKKIKLTPEERRKRRTESTLNSRRRKREMFKKALEDPSIMVSKNSESWLHFYLTILY